MTCVKAALCLLQRTVGIGQTALPTVNNAILFGGRRLIRYRSLSSAARVVRLKSDFGTLPLLRTSWLNFCTKSQSPEEACPPLPDYDNDSHSEQREVYIIQVKGLPWSCTHEDLLEFFSDCKICDGLKGIHLTTDRLTGKPSGLAFIELEHEDDVVKALEKHRTYLGPRYVQVYEVTNHDAEEILKNAVDGSSDCVVRLRGLPFSSSESDIVQFFSGLDIVQNGITIVADHQGRNSGTAFVEFASQEAFEEALTKDRESIGNRYIEVFPSRKDEIRTGWRSRINYRSPPRTDSVTHNSYRNESHVQSAPLSHYVHMRGLPFSASGEDIVRYFSPLVVSKVLIEFGPDGRPRGTADVYFSCHQEAVAAMSKDRMYIGERYVELFLNSEPYSDTK